MTQFVYLEVTRLKKTMDGIIQYIMKEYKQKAISINILHISMGAI